MASSIITLTNREITALSSSNRLSNRVVKNQFEHVQGHFLEISVPLIYLGLIQLSILGACEHTTQNSFL